MSRPRCRSQWSAVCVARSRSLDVADTLAGRFPAVAELLREAKAGLTAFADFPQAHWRKIWSTNPIERLNR